MIDARAVRAAPLFVCVCLLGCGEPPAPRTRPQRGPSDKAALFGDAALLPTRAGERARAEVALAEEIRVAIETLHPVERARVTLTLDARGQPASGSIVIRGRDGAQSDKLQRDATAIARGVVGSDTPLEVQVSLPSTPAPVEQTPLSPLLIFAVLGLGFSVGVAFDRTARQLRRRVRRRAADARPR